MTWDKVSEKEMKARHMYFLETNFPVSTAFLTHCPQRIMQGIISHQLEAICGLLALVLKYKY